MHALTFANYLLCETDFDYIMLIIPTNLRKFPWQKSYTININLQELRALLSGTSYVGIDVMLLN